MTNLKCERYTHKKKATYLNLLQKNVTCFTGRQTNKIQFETAKKVSQSEDTEPSRFAQFSIECLK